MSQFLASARFRDAYFKCQDFKIGPKFSKTHVFQGTMLFYTPH